MKVRVLGSGSAGNAIWVESGATRLLVDCGFSCRELEKRLAACDLSAEMVTGVLFTHDHSDHCKGVATFHKRHPQIPFFANGNTADAIALASGVNDGWAVFETTEDFMIGGIQVQSFSVPHDAADTVGYFFEDGQAGLFVGTDMGMATLPMKEALSRATCAVLEANHDLRLLMTSTRSEALKQRIAGRSGHLSNEQTAEALREANPRELKVLLLAHLSRECNAPHLAEDAVRPVLADLGLKAMLASLEQETPSSLYEFAR